MANKITIKEQFVAVNEVLREAGREDLVEFIDGRIALIDKKSASKKLTKTQEANEALKAIILEVLGTSKEGLTATEVLNSGRFEVGTSNQKITTLITQLVKANKVIRNQNGKHVTFTLPVVE